MNMNKWGKMLTVLVGLLLLFAVPANAAETKAKIKVNNRIEALKHSSIIVNSRLFLAVEDIAELLNGSVAYRQGTVTLKAGGKSLTFKPNTNQFLSNNVWILIDQGAIKRNDIVYLPLRWVVEKLGYQIKWDAQAKMAQLIVLEASDSFVLLHFDSLSGEEKDFVREARLKKGIHTLGNLYVIARGESPNPGYGIQFVREEMRWEQLIVYVKLTKPEPGKLYSQVISYPYLVARVNLPKNTTITFIDADTGKPLFKE
jgi:hypothetical protein